MLKPAAQVEVYAKALVGQGYDFGLFCDLAPEELANEFGFLPGHIKRVKQHLPGLLASVPGSEPRQPEVTVAAQPCSCPYGAGSNEDFSVTYDGYTIASSPKVGESDSHVRFKFTATSRSTGPIEFSERYSALRRRHEQLLASQALTNYSPQLSFPGKGTVLAWLPGGDRRVATRGNELQHYIQRLVTEASVDTLLQLSTCWAVGYTLYAAATAEHETQNHDAARDGLDVSELAAAIAAKMAEVRDKKLRCVLSGIEMLRLRAYRGADVFCNRKADIETVAEAVRELQALKQQYLEATGCEWDGANDSAGTMVDKDARYIREGDSGAPPRNITTQQGDSGAPPRNITTQQITGLCDALMCVDIDGSVLPKYRYASAGSLYPVQVYFSIREGLIEGLNSGCY